MKGKFVAIAAFASCWATAFADDPPPPPDAPRTHVDTTVVGDATPESANAPSGVSGLENDHNFQAGAPEIVSVTKQLHLSPQQQARLNQVIEQADAGAAALIKREHDVRDMIGATTPEDPLYAKLIADQSSAADRWTENRDNLRRSVIDLLTPAQRTRFDELRPKEEPQSK